ncbi:MAG TPA: glycosyltransferase family 2 protein [Gemmatimonadales bacterium]|nr:glycosyltransferase family 2 protein [Gemmatimonadales bacterium]
MQVSIVVPVYNSADCLGELVRRLEKELGGAGLHFEVVLVDDDSPDNSWRTIVDLSQRHEVLTGLRLRRNAGQDNAIMAGLRASRGEVVIVMDDDLQHDPADIPALYAAVRDGGYDVVYARFRSKRQALWKNFGSWLNDRLAVVVLGKPKEIYLSPFKAIRREVVEEVIKYEGPFSYVDGLLFTITSSIGQVEATHHPRFAGRGNYNLVKSIRVWLKLATNFSVVPLRVATLAGGIMSVMAFLAGAFFILQALFLERSPPGWPSLVVTVLFLGGVQLVGLGAVGEYVGRIYIAQNKRPQFTVRESCGHPPRGSAPSGEVPGS